MGTLLCLAQVILGSAGQNVHLMVQIFVDNLTQGQNLGLLLVIHQRQHDDAKARLQRSLLEEIIQHNLRVGILLQLDNDTHTVAVGLVPEVGNALDTLILDLICHGFQQQGLIHLIGQLIHDDAGAIAGKGLELRTGADDHLAAAGGIGCADTAATHDDTAGGEIRAGNMLQ